MNQKKSWWKKEEQRSHELPTKRVSGKAFDSLYGTSSTPDWHGSSGQSDSCLLAKQGYTHPEGLCGGAADPLDQSWTSHQALACFWRCPYWVSSGRNLCALKLLCSWASAQQTETTRLLPNHPRLQTGTLAWTGLMHNPREIKLLSFTLNPLVILGGKNCRAFIT